jgi:transcriptional regulator with XRE-family HTH domain
LPIVVEQIVVNYVAYVKRYFMQMINSVFYTRGGVNLKFGEKLRSLRVQKGISQTNLGLEVGLSLGTIRGYEKYDRYPKKREMYGKLAKALDVEESYLINEGEAFILDAAATYGSRGKKGAEKLVTELTGLFAGGDMAVEDMDEMMLAIQEAYWIVKKNNKKYTAKKYLQKDVK